jgi:acetyl esterase/lipase
MAPGLSFDPEFFEVLKPLLGLPKPNFDDPVEFRNFQENMLRERFGKLSPSPDVTETKYEIPSLDGNTIAVHRFVPSSQQQSATTTTTTTTTPQRAAVYLHGGGMILGSVALFRPLVEGYTTHAELQIFSVEYRLAPEHPAPAAVEDAFAAVHWVQDHAAEFNIDPARVALVGDSAGGGIAAGAALLARDKALSPPIARLVLQYPMLDDRTTLKADDPLHPFLFWS